MKKTSNTSRIGVSRPENLSKKFNDDQSSSSNVQKHANHQPMRKQVRDYSIFSLNITKQEEIHRLLTRNTPKLSNES